MSMLNRQQQLHRKITKKNPKLNPEKSQYKVLPPTSWLIEF